MKRHLILFKDGTSAMLVVHVYNGGCLTGDTTTYVYRDDRFFTWVKPGDSVDFVEAYSKPGDDR